MSDAEKATRLHAAGCADPGYDQIYHRETTADDTPRDEGWRAEIFSRHLRQLTPAQIGAVIADQRRRATEGPTS